MKRRSGVFGILLGTLGVTIFLGGMALSIVLRFHPIIGGVSLIAGGLLFLGGTASYYKYKQSQEDKG